MDDVELAAAFAEGLSGLGKSGMDFVLAHGGGPQINALLKRLAIESHFVNGLRVTDDATLEAVEMVLCGQVNKALTRVFSGHGIKAVGLSGQDDRIIQAEPDRPELGHVGRITGVNVELIEILLKSGRMPVIAPLAVSTDGSCLNINADTAAGAIAGALCADYFVLVSDVPGVLDENKNLMPSLDRSAISDLKARGVISGGMIPKVDSCLNALDAGCKRALILDGRAKMSLSRYLLDGEPLGTIINN